MDQLTGSGRAPRRLWPLAVLWLGLLPAPALQRVGDRFVDDAGRVELLAWAFGTVALDQLEEYHNAGLNVLYLELGQGADEARQRRLARAAADRGMQVILGLNCLDATRPDESLDPSDAEAVRATTDWLAGVVADWRDTPGLLAYALQHEAEDRIAWTQPALAAHLAAVYAVPANLNALWGSALNSFGEVTPEAIAELDRAAPSGVSPASFEVARWRLETANRLIGRWVEAVHAADPTRPVIGGRAARLRELLNAPSSLAGLQPSVDAYGLGHRRPEYPVEAVSIAHQNGRYAVIPVLDANAPPAELDDSIPLCVGRGACGVSFSSWAALADGRERLGLVRMRLGEARRQGWAAFRPSGTAAILTQPYVRGPAAGRRDLFGYGAFGGDEPAGLLELIRRGTRFGLLSILTPRDLQTTDLSRFAVVFASSLFELHERDLADLEAYVAGGGRLFADLGIGCLGPPGDLAAMPEPLAELFGLEVSDVRPLHERALHDPRDFDRLMATAPGEAVFPELDANLSHPGSLRFLRRSYVFPSIIPVEYTSPQLSRTLLLAPAAFVHPGEETRVVAEQAQSPERRDGRPAVCGLSIHPHGDGLGLFWGTFAWQGWGPAEPTFTAVMESLLGQQPPLVLRGEPLIPAAIRIARGDDGVFLENLTGQDLALEFDLAGYEPSLYAGGLNLIRRPELLPDGPQPGRSRWGFVNRRLVDLAPGETRYNAASPLQLWPQQAAAAAELELYSPDRLELTVYGSGGTPGRSTAGGWIVPDPNWTEVHLIIGDGPYRLEPGELHRAEWVVTELRPTGTFITRETTTLTVTGDRQIVIRRPVYQFHLRLTPLRDRPAGGAAARE